MNKIDRRLVLEVEVGMLEIPTINQLPKNLEPFFRTATATFFEDDDNISQTNGTADDFELHFIRPLVDPMGCREW